MLFEEKQHPLDDLRVRLEWAEKNIADLEFEVREFQRIHPNVFTTHLDLESRNVTHTVGHTGTLRELSNLSVRIGIIVFLLRSSLDHLIAQLLIPVNDRKDIDGILEKSAFPIYTDPMKYQSFKWTKIPNISSKAQKAIHDLQPCNRTDGLPFEDHPLAILQCLNNIDKHRVLIRVGEIVVLGSIGGSTQYRGEMFEIKDPAFIGPGQRQAIMVITRAHQNETVDMQVNSFVEVAFENVGSGKSEPVIPTLNELLKAVKAIVDDFQRQFF